MPIQAIDDRAWPAIMRIQTEVYRQTVQESLAVLTSKWQAGPTTCALFMAEDGSDEPVAYLLAHPWSSPYPPHLDRAAAIDDRADDLYLHDLALSSRAQGQGIATRLVEDLLAKARAQQVGCIRLVAIQGSQGFWARFGFVSEPDAVIDRGYGRDASLMCKTLC
jgi:GNAT superfamily N-acetyltransferase